MSWIDRMLSVLVRGGRTGDAQSTDTELVREKVLRRIERDRTDKLARLIADYRAQDGALRR